MLVGALALMIAANVRPASADVTDCIKQPRPDGPDPASAADCGQGGMSELIPCRQVFKAPLALWEWTVTGPPIPQVLPDAGPLVITVTCSQAGTYYYWDIEFKGALGTVICSGNLGGDVSGTIVFPSVTPVYNVDACRETLQFLVLNPGVCRAEVGVSGGLGGITVEGTTILALGDCAQLP